MQLTYESYDMITSQITIQTVRFIYPSLIAKVFRKCTKNFKQF